MSIAAPALGDAYALASTTCFATANVLIARGTRPGVQDNGAFVSLLLTAGISGLAWLALGIHRGFEPVTWRAIAWFAGAGVFTAYIGRVFYYASVQHLGAMRASTIKRLNPFFAVILGVAVLGEALTGGMAVGLACIAASFAVLLNAGREAPRAGEASGLRRLLNAGYLYGPISALGYATGYLLRKMGLADAHDALLGACVGTLTGALIFLATARFRVEYARAVRATFARPNPWLLAAGAMSSFGQILYFAALNVSAMSRVALISSMEVFVTLFLGFLLLRRRESLTRPIALAAALGVAGTVSIIVG
ncbi:MAG TPA: EamA family transporter [Usitatibacter sp.]|nr:EamA family transporter [Usitatibacter sp.]